MAPANLPGLFQWPNTALAVLRRRAKKGIFSSPQNTVGSRVVAHVLCTGADHTLLHTRKLILEHAGHTVVSASSEPEVREACAQRQIDVAVIGQSVSAPQKQRVFALVREACPTAKILELVPPYSTKALHDADDWLEAPMEVPDEFVEKVAKLARRRKRREAG